jgi:hypothetical protein
MSAVVVDSRPLNREGSERQPLLPKTPSDNDELGTSDDRDVEHSTEDNLAENLIADPKPEPANLTASNRSFYILLTLFGLFMLVIVIKGFVDAKDPTDHDADV